MNGSIFALLGRDLRTVLLATAMVVTLIAANVAVASRNFVLRRSLDDLKNQIAAQETQLKASTTRADEDSEIETFLSDWQRQQIDNKSIPALMTRLADHAAATGLQVVRITPRSSTTSEWLLSYPFETEFRGKSEQFLKFLHRLEHNTGAIIVRSIVMERTNEADSDLRVRIDFTVYGEKSG